jgi:hypothetical protein
MGNIAQSKVEKKAYIKPLVTEVRLVAQEAVLGVCKDGNGGLSLCNGISACNASQPTS